MPTLDATTSAAFTSAGISATGLYSFLTGLFGQGYSFALWIIQAIWPFLLVIGVLGVFYAIASAMRHWGR